jgi:hypothetical protein
VFAEKVGRPMAQGIAVGFQSQMSGSSTGISTSLAPGVLSGGYGGAPITVVYSPAMSLGNRAEFEAELVPVLDNAMRRSSRGKV